MPDLFIKKLCSLTDLTASDIEALENAITSPRCYTPHQDIIREGDEPGAMLVVLEGWACRYKILSNGSRQIIGYLIPGDSSDLPIGFPTEMDHSILSITATTVASISRSELQNLTDQHPRIDQALSLAHRSEEGILRSWIVSMGRRNATERIAHLLYELYLRLKNIGLAKEGAFSLPLTQAILADTLGLTPVHVNRTLMELRLTEIIAVCRGHVTITNPKRLIKIAGFDDNYLHLGSIDRAEQSGVVAFHQSQVSEPVFHI